MCVIYCSVDGSVTLKSYEASSAGMVQSWVDRFPTTDVDKKLMELWDQDKAYFQ